MQITEYSGQSSVGIATLNLYLNKLTPLRQIDLKVVDGQQVVVMTGPHATLVSNSFGWGQIDERSTALSQATAILGMPVAPEVFHQIPPDQERIIHTSRSYQGPRQRL